MTILTLMSYRPILCVALAGVLACGVLLSTARSRARASAPEPILPDLVADPPDNASLETSDTEGGLSATEKEPELLLRFNGYVHNIGPGPLEFRGKRQAPKLAGATQAKVQQAEEEVENGKKEELELPQQTEEELASPPMEAFQRLYASNAGAPTSESGEKANEENEKYLERLHENEPSSAEMFYVNADGHHHWHLQHVARYSLWNAEKTAEVAPAQKVGFCLEDSEHVEPAVGPPHPVYADTIAPFRDFCQQFHPDTQEVYEGISPGWRDRYTSDLGFQWVNASNVLPGEYWLREDVDPTGVIKEAGGTKTPAYATSPTIIPGFDAQAQTVSTQGGEARTVTLTARAWNDPATPNYAVVSEPRHGRLTWVSNNQITYTPSAGYSGADSFTFSAGDPNSQFPLSPAVATVAIDVAPAAAATVTINGAPASMVDGRRIQLSSVESNCPVITWNATAGSITPLGRYTAPSESPLTGTATVSATCGNAAEAKRTIKVLGLSRPQAGLSGRRLLMATRVSEAGRVSLSAYLGKRLLGTCATESRAERTFSCAVTLGNHVSLDARIGVVATLRFEHSALRAVRPAARVAMIKTKKPSKVHAHKSSSGGPAGSSQAAILVGLSGESAAIVAPAPAVAIEGAPSRMIAGTSVKISAIVEEDSPTVTWTVDSGSITSAGVYTAPSVPPPAARVVVAARSSNGAEDRRTITILPVPVARAAPSAPLPPQASSPSTRRAVTSAPDASTAALAELARPQAMLIGRELIMTTRVGAPGRVRLSAYIGRSRVGSCAAETPANRSFTCRLELGNHVALDARVAVLGGLRTSARELRSTRPAAPAPEMKMTGPSDLVANGTNSASWEFLCSL